MFMIMMGTIVIAGIAGNMPEKTGSTHNGYLQLIIICTVRAPVLFRPHHVLDQLGPTGLYAVLYSIGALIIVPTHWRN